MENDDQKKTGPRGPYRKRHWCVDQVTGKRFRAASPFALYSNDANQQYAKRQRRKQRAAQLAERARQAQANIDRQIEARRKAEAVARDELKRESEKRAAAIRHDTQQAREIRERQARAEAVKRLYSPCTCGSTMFNVQTIQHLSLFGTKVHTKLLVKCAKLGCGKESKQVILPGICPACKKYVYRWSVASGDLICFHCKKTRQWGDYPTDVPLPEPYDKPDHLA